MDRRNYFKHVTELVDNFFKAFDLNLDEGLALTHHGNLLPTTSGKEPDKDKLASGAWRILHVIRETHPKCIIALTVKVSDILKEQIPYEPVDSQELGKYGRYTRRWRLLKLKMSGEQVLFSRVPMHPSWPTGWRYLVHFGRDLGRIAKTKLCLDGANT